MVREPRPEASRPHEEEEPHIPTSQSPLLETNQTSDSLEQQATLLLQPQAESPTSHGVSAPLLAHDGSQVPSQPAPERRWPSTLPPPVARWACGQQRKDLRDEFNTLEICAVQLLKTYDLDNSGALDKKELKSLLQDYSNRDKPVSDADVSYVMMVADKNHDDTIDQQEILYGLGAWHAWNHMPMSVGATFTRKNIGQGLPLPSMEALHEVMVILNESQPVERDELEYVHSLAVGLGATAECATNEQMRRAIAPWYMNIERAVTSTKKSCHGLAARCTPAGFLAYWQFATTGATTG